MEFLRLAALIGFIATATLLLNLNFKVFRDVFKERTITFFWLYLLMIIVPILLILYLFSLLFG
ncbi:MAG: hypothetical protein ACC618_01750 [Patescibacteria group bacterium]